MVKLYMRIFLKLNNILWFWHMLLQYIKHSGSEFDVVILVVPQASNMLLTRNLLYTGITRAKKLLVVIGPKNLIEFMINNSEIKKRNTGLERKLKC